jgi:hypothetical protein
MRAAFAHIAAWYSCPRKPRGTSPDSSQFLLQQLPVPLLAQQLFLFFLKLNRASEQQLLFGRVSDSLLLGQEPQALLFLSDEFPALALLPLNFCYNGSTMGIISVHVMYTFFHVRNLLAKNIFNIREDLFALTVSPASACCGLSRFGGGTFFFFSIGVGEYRLRAGRSTLLLAVTLRGRR